MVRRHRQEVNHLTYFEGIVSIRIITIASIIVIISDAKGLNVTIRIGIMTSVPNVLVVDVNPSLLCFSCFLHLIP